MVVRLLQRIGWLQCRGWTLDFGNSKIRNSQCEIGVSKLRKYSGSMRIYLFTLHIHCLPPKKPTNLHLQKKQFPHNTNHKPHKSSTTILNNEPKYHSPQRKTQRLLRDFAPRDCTRPARYRYPYPILTGVSLYPGVAFCAQEGSKAVK